MQHAKCLSISFLALVSLELACWCEGHHLQVPTPENRTLHHLLCTKKGRNSIAEYDNSSDFLVISLSPLVSHTLSPDSPCFLENITNLTITGGDTNRQHQFSTISCDGIPCGSGGIVFSNIAALTIERVKVEKCSGVLVPKPKFSTEPPNYPFTFYFFHCKHVLLHELSIQLDCPSFVIAKNTLQDLSFMNMAVCVIESSYDLPSIYHTTTANRLIGKHEENHAVSIKKVPKLNRVISVLNEKANPRLNITFSHCKISTSTTIGNLPGVIKFDISRATVACVIDNLCLSNTILKIIFIHPSSQKSCVTNPATPVLTIANSNFTNKNTTRFSTIAFKSFDVNKQQIQVLIQNLRLSNFPNDF